MKTQRSHARMRTVMALAVLCGGALACALFSASDTQTPAELAPLSTATAIRDAPATSPTSEEEAPAMPDAPATSPANAEEAPATPFSRRESQSDWLHFGVDDQFSSYTPHETQITPDNVAQLKRLWGAGCDDGLFAVYGGTPALYGGRIFVTYAGGRLEAGDPFTGAKIWDFGENAHGWAPPPVVSEDGIIYYQYVTSDASAKLFAVRAETGQQLWEAATQFKTGFNFDAQVTVDEARGLVFVVEAFLGMGVSSPWTRRLARSHGSLARPPNCRTKSRFAAPSPRSERIASMSRRRYSMAIPSASAWSV